MKLAAGLITSALMVGGAGLARDAGEAGSELLDRAQRGVERVLAQAERELEREMLLPTRLR